MAHTTWHQDDTTLPRGAAQAPPQAPGADMHTRNAPHTEPRTWPTPTAHTTGHHNDDNPAARGGPRPPRRHLGHTFTHKTHHTHKQHVTPVPTDRLLERVQERGAVRNMQDHNLTVTDETDA